MELSLCKKLSIAVVTVTVLPLVIAFTIMSRTTEQAMMRNVYVDNENTTKNIALDLDQLITEKIRMLKVNANNDEIRSMNDNMQVAVVRDIKTQSSAVENVTTVDALGREIVSAEEMASEEDYKEQEYFKNLMTTGETAISDARVNNSTGQVIFTIAEPIKDDSKKTVGALILYVDLERLMEHVAGVPASKGGYVYITNHEGKLLVHPNHQFIQEELNVSYLAPVKASVQGLTGTLEYESDER